jgi:hypothetical protein
LLCKFSENSALLSMGVPIGVGVGSIAVAAVLVIWLRKRRLKQITNLRDSALW